MNQIKEAVKVNNGKLVYVVQLTTENGNQKLQLYYDESKYNGAGIRFEDNHYNFSNYNVFDIRSEGHRIAKEIFLTHLQAEIKTKILELKQLELVLDELGLVGVIRKTISENATMLLDVKDEIIEETIKATDKIIEKKTNKKVLKELEKVKEANAKTVETIIEVNEKNTRNMLEQTKEQIDEAIEEQVRPIARKRKK